MVQKWLMTNGLLLTTGASSKNMKMNIYDLAGNVYEWTLEKSNNVLVPCTSRTGTGYSDGTRTASYRYYFRTMSSFNTSGFRSALY